MPLAVGVGSSVGTGVAVAPGLPPEPPPPAAPPFPSCQRPFDAPTAPPAPPFEFPPVVPPEFAEPVDAELLGFRPPPMTWEALRPYAAPARSRTPAASPTRPLGRRRRPP